MRDRNGSGNTLNSDPFNPMTPEFNTFTLDPNVCSVLGCAMQTDPIETCRDHRCPHRWQREAAEDRARRGARDAAGKGEGVGVVVKPVRTSEAGG